MGIIRSEDICFGRPRIENTRLEVYNVISDLYYHNEGIETYLSDNKNLSHNSLIDLVDYCKNLKCQIINKSYEKYCSGCLLSTLHENFNYKEINLQQLDEDVYIDDQKNIYLGSKEEIENELYGKPGWIIASEVSEKFKLHNQ